jgi:hypothetical protein
VVGVPPAKLLLLTHSNELLARELPDVATTEKALVEQRLEDIGLGLADVFGRF